MDYSRSDREMDRAILAACFIREGYFLPNPDYCPTGRLNLRRFVSRATLPVTMLYRTLLRITEPESSVGVGANEGTAHSINFLTPHHTIHKSPESPKVTTIRHHTIAYSRQRLRREHGSSAQLLGPRPVAQQSRAKPMKATRPTDRDGKFASRCRIEIRRLALSRRCSRVCKAFQSLEVLEYLRLLEATSRCFTALSSPQVHLPKGLQDALRKFSAWSNMSLLPQTSQRIIFQEFGSHSSAIQLLNVVPPRPEAHSPHMPVHLTADKM
ncbi:hypothetical protein GGR55DRAFT_681317 [Xylaria sp. FL0064]|nr:hypothetical protein GGR55DRAFT_681317 [Xylaria sp. FL0064]